MEIAALHTAYGIISQIARTYTAVICGMQLYTLTMEQISSRFFASADVQFAVKTPGFFLVGILTL